MKPENKKEIQLGWWKFVGLQATTVAIICLVFFFAGIFPKRLENDYITLINEAKARLAVVKQSKYEIEQLVGILVKIDINTITPEQGKQIEMEFERLKSLSEKSNNPSHYMAFQYVVVLKKYSELNKKMAELNANGNDDQMKQMIHLLQQEKAQLKIEKDAAEANLRCYATMGKPCGS
jgi:hypothetical protein